MINKERKIQKEIKSKKSRYWMMQREKKSIVLFRLASKYVPAYKRFLNDNGINPSKIRRWEDFKSVPPVSKSNYLRVYPYHELFWEGTLNKPMVFTATSGSTGIPFYFPRMDKIDWQNSVFAETFLKQNFDEVKTPILVIVCFGMGIWIGGLINYKSFDYIARRENLPISIITPGINSKEIIKALKNVASHYKQVILVGYPPFLKDVIDKAESEDINLKKMNIRLLFATETITEEYRDYMCEHLNIKDKYRDVMNIYGSAELGAMAQETSVSTLTKRLLTSNKKIFADFFGQSEKTPTLAQFLPYFVNFEEVDKKLLITGDSAIPLIRYDIGDIGGVLSYDEMEHRLEKLGVDFNKEIVGNGLSDFNYKLPFVYVYERSDLSTSFYGLWVYPEWIKPALFKEPINKYLSGKFTLITKLDKNKNQYLELNLELKDKQKVAKNIEKRILKTIVKSMTDHSSEFRELHDHLKKKAEPKLYFWPNGHETYFALGGKQKWVKKEE